MKKFLSVFLLLAIFLCSCAAIDISGIHNFSTADCSNELTKYLFPDDEFLNTYSYIDGDYQYHAEDDWDGGLATAYAALTYSPDIYNEAKTYCKEYFEFCGEHQYTYGGFEFQEHLCHLTRDANDELVTGCCFPKNFNIFAYNDQSCTLVFLGYYNPNRAETEMIETNFDAFLQHTFGQG